MSKTTGSGKFVRAYEGQAAVVYEAGSQQVQLQGYQLRICQGVGD